MEKQFIRSSTNFSYETNNNNFKTFNVSRLITLSPDKNDINTILDAKTTATILSSKLVKTPSCTTLSGTILTGHKLFFKGYLNSNIKYITDDINSSIYYDNFKLIFVESISLADNYSYNASDIISTIIDVSANKVDSHSIFINIVVMIKLL